MKEWIENIWFTFLYWVKAQYKKIKYFFIRTYYKWFKKDKTMKMILYHKPELGEVFRTAGFNQPLLTYIGKETYIIGKTTHV